MLKTCESETGPASPVLVLFYAALFLLLSSNTVWSRVTGVTVYEQTSGPANWSQHHRRESEESVLSTWERIRDGQKGVAALFNSQRNFLSSFYAHTPRRSLVLPPDSAGAGETQPGLLRIKLWQPAASQAPEVYHFPSAPIVRLLPLQLYFPIPSSRDLSFTGLLLPRSDGF